jgi:hypothetical protein
VNEASAKMRNAVPFRSVLAYYVASKALLSTIGLGLDSMNVVRYSNTFAGRWRIFNEDGSDFFATIAPHPTQPDYLEQQAKTAKAISIS